MWEDLGNLPLVLVILPGPPCIYAVRDEPQNHFHTLQDIDTFYLMLEVSMLK